ncbi:MAG: hypothetical protein KatS3mg111_3914 [Pirellulaceae bacterium]|nr:MAG: hypothetical protein KatS3mg111_3914 [Pirellulaceae bacterium]
MERSSVPSAGSSGETATVPQQLYTPAMLADLLGISVSRVRRWYRAGLLPAASEVLQLPHFDFCGLATARQLARWSAGGITVASLQQQLTALRQRFGREVPLTELPIRAEGKRLVLIDGDVTVEANGQMRLPLDLEASGDKAPESWESEDAPRAVIPFPRAAIADQVPDGPSQTLDLEAMVDRAMMAEDELELDAALDWYRAALAAHGPRADVCFQLAELLYRMGDLEAARERYFMALELDPNLVEARASLGCVLAEEGQLELAVAAFEGALQQFPQYADVHFHLARTLDDLNEPGRAAEHWSRFLELAPDSPWAQEARQRLQSDAPLLDF